MKIKSVVSEATGQWEWVFQQIGIVVPRRGKHGPCPICGDGVDRFHFDDLEGRGTWHCRKCEGKKAGDGLALVSRVYGIDYGSAARLVADCLGYDLERGQGGGNGW